MNCPETYRAGPYWYMRVKVIEEYICPKCDMIHHKERQQNDQRTQGFVQCPGCDFRKEI